MEALVAYLRLEVRRACPQFAMPGTHPLWGLTKSGGLWGQSSGPAEAVEGVRARPAETVARKLGPSG